ncbi:cytochrome c-type biogenesis protein CcsB [Haloactinospora alba]|uniref:Cytochrome c-type biogenesis protein CcsB n=1 Tax=Haloactinospora alba TaxID=405555 RepID=A0A543NMQ8_9ACTN|nr:c-type cytochrome biogenesis protein CcsB [Haloactinospora alba]TQN33118.1 cytochrome c-type biogenesis protein CcsB [Haloactinospora alba]
MVHALAADAASAQNTTLSSVSDELLVATIVGYAVALFLFACEAAYGRREALRSGRLVSVGAGASGSGSSAGGNLDEADDMEVSVRHEEEQARAPRHLVGRVGVLVTAVAFALNLAQVVTRGIAADRWPWGNMFEFVVAICLCAVAAFLYAAVRYQARFLGTFVLIPVVLLLGIGVKWLYSQAGPVIPALDSYWIAIHVSAMIIATGGFLVSGVAGIAYLMAQRTEVKQAAGETVTGIPAKLPSSGLLDRVSHRFVVFAFPIWTFAIIAGAIWADEAWGRFWGWDPKEVWSFITWTVYAAYLHARHTAGWRGNVATWIGLVGLACLLFNFFGVNYIFSGLHSYA